MIKHSGKLMQDILSAKLAGFLRELDVLGSRTGRMRTTGDGGGVLFAGGRWIPGGSNDGNVTNKHLYQIDNDGGSRSPATGVKRCRHHHRAATESRRQH